MATAVHRSPPEAIRAAIIEATIRLIGREGVDGITHRAVAHEAGVSLSSTTYHFVSRDEIVSEALRHVAALEIERIARDAETLAEGHADVPSIARALAAWLAEQVHGDELLRVRAGYHLQLEAGRRPELRAIHVAWGQAVHGLAERRLAAPAYRREHPLERHRRPAPGRGDRAAPRLRAPRAPGDRAPALDPHGAVNAAALRKACLAMTGAEETFPFGPENSVFKVEGKIFAISRLGTEPPLRISLKCEPGLAEQLRVSHAAITPGYHLNKRHWNTIVLDGSVADAMVRDMIEDSYDLIVARLPKRKQQALGWTGA
jgi:predicted DNA-binding protein (MmcQ/YjbR family)/DNA-binding transcriptional regulator YbjK